MKISINGKEYDVEIIHKNNKNMYLRVTDDLRIVVTAPLVMPFSKIKNFVLNNIDYIEKVISKKEVIYERKKGKFLYLGNYYDICYINKRIIEFGDTKVFIGRDVNIDNWYKKRASAIFSVYYDECFDKFRTFKKKPLLKIRKMKGKWGVCNITNNTITLNLELIKHDPRYLRYVIYHELCHLKHPNHSSSFWNEVSKYVPDYKVITKEMKSI